MRPHTREEQASFDEEHASFPSGARPHGRQRRKVCVKLLFRICTWHGTALGWSCRLSPMPGGRRRRPSASGYVCVCVLLGEHTREGDLAAAGGLHAHALADTDADAHKDARTHTHVCVYTHTYISISQKTTLYNTHTHIHTYTHTHIHTHTHTHTTHTHTQIPTLYRHWTSAATHRALLAPTRWPCD